MDLAVQTRVLVSERVQGEDRQYAGLAGVLVEYTEPHGYARFRPDVPPSWTLPDGTLLFHPEHLDPAPTATAVDDGAPPEKIHEPTDAPAAGT